MRPSVDVLEWLLKGDPAIRWQVMRDLLGKPRKEWEAQQALVASTGWGARLLRRQDATGRWTPRVYGQKWISTTYTMLLLRDLGLPRDNPQAARACKIMLDECTWRDGGMNPARSLHRSEECFSGMVLAIVSWFGFDDHRREDLVTYLLREQMADGGWNCQRYRGATHGSFHTTINVLEGLRAYAEVKGDRRVDVVRAERAAREFFLTHRLYRSHRTGEVSNPAFTRFSFPPRWHHDVLRTLEYFRTSDAPYDERLEDPVELVRRRRKADGRWILQNKYPGRTFFELEAVGRPSRWNTLRALRVLDWFEQVAS